MHRTSSRPRAFTIVELLVVVGIIAVLIAILIPVLGRARDIAKSTACVANTRSLGEAARAFANDHNGYLQPVSNDNDWGSPAGGWITAVDPTHRRWAYSAQNNGYAVDWVSALIAYMGGTATDSINNIQSLTTYTSGGSSGTVLSRWVTALRCPTDSWLNDKNPGYKVFNNVSWNTSAYYPISYGVNADICCLVDPGPPYTTTPGFGRFAGTPSMNPAQDGLNIAFDPTTDTAAVAAAAKNSAGFGQPLSGRINQVRSPAATLLYADCGTRPSQWGSTFPPSGDALDFNDILCYTSNWATSNGALTAKQAKTLDGVAQCSWLGNRIPSDGNNFVSSPPRHRDAINISFVDGHSETVHRAQFGNVLVSPW
jgi:prepilin-type N-terminal cleavage/methylation domain-containing protein/prepilin-type processing-associated H-X9-DG protein